MVESFGQYYNMCLFISTNRMYLTFAALETILNVAMSYKLSSLDDNELKTIMQFYSEYFPAQFLLKVLFVPGSPTTLY